VVLYLGLPQKFSKVTHFFLQDTDIHEGVGYSEKCDVYSFAIVLWELLTRKEPFVGMNKPDIIVGVPQGLRPPIPENCSAPYAQLIADCWMDDPSKRPAFAEILHRLEQLQLSTESKLSKEISTVMPTPMNITHQFKSFQETVNTWEIEPSELQFMEEVSEGTNATVYKGNFRGQQVAIKVLKESLDGKHKEDFKKELEVMRYDIVSVIIKHAFSSLRSPSVVFFYGATLNPHLAIVTELLPNGSLFDIMNRQDIKCDWELVIKLCTESAKAINTLHSWKPSVVHRDIKPQNLLVCILYNQLLTPGGGPELVS
jgi:serine/threonine protein kinase